MPFCGWRRRPRRPRTTASGSTFPAAKSGFKAKRAAIDTQWDGTCRLGKATAVGSFTRRYQDAQSGTVVETYTGRWIEGRQQGKGHYENTLGTLYDGEFKDGLPDGMGMSTAGLTAAAIRVAGRRACASGRGTYNWANGASYEGDWVGDRRTGWGVYLGTKGDSYEGVFLDGAYHGRGTFNWAAGPRFEGEFKNGDPHGKGVLFVSSGDEVRGEFRGDKLVGAGRCWRAKVDRWFNCAQDGARIEDVN